MKKTMENQFTTSDFYTAVFLLAREYKLLGINKKTNPRRFRFVFEDQKGRAELLEDFFNGTTTVEPRGFITAIKELKSLRLDEAQEVLALVKNIYKTYVNAPDELKRLYLGLFWDRFEASEKLIQKAEPIDLIKAMIKERSVILHDNALLQTQNPEPIMAGACAPEREVIISNFWGA